MVRRHLIKDHISEVRDEVIACVCGVGEAGALFDFQVLQPDEEVFGEGRHAGQRESLVRQRRTVSTSGRWPVARWAV